MNELIKETIELRKELIKLRDVLRHAFMFCDIINDMKNTRVKSLIKKHKEIKELGCYSELVKEWEKTEELQAIYIKLYEILNDYNKNEERNCIDFVIVDEQKVIMQLYRVTSGLLDNTGLYFSYVTKENFPQTYGISLPFIIDVGFSGSTVLIYVAKHCMDDEELQEGSEYDSLPFSLTERE